tara:strand:- start:5639 stop:6082 length:444 start_codon:yes stop_codon:yes gene_type:complete
MSKLETCHHCGEQKEDCYHGFIAMCLPIPEAEAKIEKWNLIDAFYTYGQRIISENLWMLVAIDWPSTQEEFNNKIKTDPEFSKKWFTNKWFNNLEREDLTPEEMKELDNLSSYDQMLNTVGKGVQCDDCGRKEAELYEKHYPENLES